MSSPSKLANLQSGFAAPQIWQAGRKLARSAKRLRRLASVQPNLKKKEILEKRKWSVIAKFKGKTDKGWASEARKVIHRNKIAERKVAKLEEKTERNEQEILVLNRQMQRKILTATRKERTHKLIIFAAAILKLMGKRIENIDDESLKWLQSASPIYWDAKLEIIQKSTGVSLPDESLWRPLADK